MLAPHPPRLPLPRHLAHCSPRSTVNLAPLHTLPRRTLPSITFSAFLHLASPRPWPDRPQSHYPVAPLPLHRGPGCATTGLRRLARLWPGHRHNRPHDHGPQTTRAAVDKRTRPWPRLSQMSILRPGGRCGRPRDHEPKRLARPWPGLAPTARPYQGRGWLRIHGPGRVHATTGRATTGRRRLARPWTDEAVAEDRANDAAGLTPRLAAPPRAADSL